MITCQEIMSRIEIIFFDFDGVIKESVEIKTLAFSELFSEYGRNVQKKVRHHHSLNSGVSRSKKFIFYYKEYLGVDLSESELQECSDKFSEIVVKQVIASKWVPNVLSFLERLRENHECYVVTATPQSEIEHILNELGINSFFRGVFGAPREKSEIMQSIIRESQFTTEKFLMIGDGLTDYYAAQKVGVQFLLRETTENTELFKNIQCHRIADFSGLIFENA